MVPIPTLPPVSIVNLTWSLVPNCNGVEFPEHLDSFLWRPVLAGMWMQHELYSGVYDFGDLVDVNAVLDWKDDNARSNMETQVGNR